MRPVLIAVALLVGALALGLGLGVLTGAPPATPSAPPRARAATPEPPSSPRPAQPPVSRDMLRYQQQERPAPPPERREPLGPIITIPVAPPPPAERLVGFVRRGGQLQAALALPGAGTVVLGPGQGVDGYEVVSVDEEAGVVLRLPDGSELALRPPAS